ncbi:ParB N-terminal domain-containing protein [Glutamicibacter sp.]|uniref:ParB/RepB/Spo0J family partition protein n=1 Tax=Glutamicibacter sp. TaxID=1931995 RepID=UPI0028BE8CEE|nr:ParB N-terminal domain-containing protein [Glutamicibacter sp.]
MASFKGRLEVLAASSIHQHPDNIRADLGDLTQLTAEIKEMGLINPLLVYPHPERAGDYVVQDGNRRRAACIQAGLSEIPCVVHPSPERGQRADVEAMLTTGRNHRPLTEAEVSKGVQTLLDLGMHETTIGKKFKMPRTEIRTRAKVARKDDALSKAYTSGRLRLDAVQRLQDLEENSDVPGLYERAVERIEGMTNGASVETVERVIAETEISIFKAKRKDALVELGAVEGDYDMQYGSKWSKVEDEMTDEEHVAAKPRYYFGYQSAEPTWYAKAVKAKPELSKEEKLDKKIQDKLNGMLPIVQRTRLAFIQDKLQTVKPDDSFAKRAIAEQVVANLRYEESLKTIFGPAVGFPYVDEDNPDDELDPYERWTEDLTKHLAKQSLAGLGRLLAFSNMVYAEEDLSKLRGFERSQWEQPQYGSAWKRRRQYYLFLQEQLGYELDLDEIEAMQYQALKEPARNRELDLVEVPDDVCKSCGTSPFEPTGAEICTGCASTDGEVA